jgi:hypothetical protein
MMTLLETIGTKMAFFGKNLSVMRKEKLIKKTNLQILVIDPHSHFIRIWIMLIFFLLAYNAGATPFRVSFHTSPTSTGLFAFETMTDVVLFLDIIITFFTPYQRIDGSYENNNRKIARRYMQTYFLVDFFVIVPTQFFESSYEHHDT